MKPQSENERPIYRKFLIIVACLAGAWWCRCVDKPVSEPSALELDRVWQHMTLYSLYHSRIPDRQQAQQMPNPQSLVKSINDTLYHWIERKSYYYGTYYPAGYESYRKALHREASSELLPIQKLSDSIIYVHIPEFNQAAYTLLANANSIYSTIPSCIIDLRCNPGGLIDACTSIVNLFLPDTTPYLKVTYRHISQTAQGSFFAVDSQTRWTTGRTNTQVVRSIWRNKKIALLINRFSASASELLAVALGDALGARVLMVGDTSFGKAIGQYIFYFNYSSGATLRITGFRFFPIRAADYHQKGIVPGICLPGTGIHNLRDTEGEQLWDAARRLQKNLVNNADTLAFQRVIKYYNAFVEQSPAADETQGCNAPPITESPFPY